jgi:hypothetical protein
MREIYIKEQHLIAGGVEDDPEFAPCLTNYDADISFSSLTEKLAACQKTLQYWQGMEKATRDLSRLNKLFKVLIEELQEQAGSTSINNDEL